MGFAASVLWEEGWGAGWWALLGFALYALIDRFVHPVCAFCRAQDSTSRWPLVLMTAALAIHSLMDGALLGANTGLRWAVVAHWIPETVAVFFLLRSVASGREAWAAYGILQAMTALGYLTAHALPFATEATLASAGALSFLALHGLHETYAHEPKRLWLSAGAAGLVWLLAR